jgi:endo-alpha-1,4-polygalactosaminidase (GH114 family)
MIERRVFVLGLGGLLVAGRAFAEVRANGRIVPDDPRKLKDIPDTPLEQIPNHRQFMRDIVIQLSGYAKGRDGRFSILARDAPELLVKESRETEWEAALDPDGAAAGKYAPVDTVVRPYLNAIDGWIIDGLFFGREEIGQPTADSRNLLRTAQAVRHEGRRALTIEYCTSRAEVSAAVRQAAEAKTLAYVTGDRQLGRIPRDRPASENPDHVTDLRQVRNFLPMFRSTGYGSRDDWVAALAATNYDLLLLDPFWRGSEALTADDIKQLKYKRVGTERLIFATLPIGRAADSRYYWKPEWQAGHPAWLEAEDPETPSQMIVRYWDPAWKELLGGYMKGIMDSGYDGVMLDYLDAYKYFEEMMPLR